MTRRSEKKEGQVLVLFALFLVVLIGATAITVDYGSWLKSRRDYQNAADAAVLAGGGFLSRPITAPKRDQARRAAWESLNNQLNLGLSNGQLTTLMATNTPQGSPQSIRDYRIWVSTPPIGAGSNYPGAFAGANDRYLFAWVEKSNPSFFSQIFGQGSRNVGAWATAGVFASQFAVVTLRQNGQGPVNAPSDIALDGSNTIFRVANGDVGGNWGMKLTSSANLYLTGDADAYLVDYQSCGNSCWSPNQVSDGAGTFKIPQPLPNIIEDPNYPLPSVINVNSPFTSTSIPQAVGSADGTRGTRVGDVTITKGTTSGSGCAPGGPRLGPGWYNDIDIQNGACVVLDPTQDYSDPNDINPVDNNYGMTDVPSNRQPGIFYITGKLSVGTGALVVGEGVTIVLRKTDNQENMNVSGGAGSSGGAIVVNQALKKAAFQTDGSYSYGFTSGKWIYTGNDADKSSVGIAVYVVKPSQYGISTADASTDQIKIAAGAALNWQGVLYAPRDNITLSGQPLHQAIGQFISWTVKIAGGSELTQTYDGPGEAAPRLVEPKLGQP